MKLFGEEELYYFNKLEENIPGIILAGGAIRDYLNKKEYNDVDIFINAGDSPINKYGYAYLVDEIIGDLFDLSSNGDAKFLDVFSNNYVDSISNCGIENILEINKNDRKYQLVFLSRNPISYLKKFFDFNCCKIFYSNRQVHKSQEYKTFDSTRQLEIMYPNKNIKFLQKHLFRAKKILSKYTEVTKGPNLQQLELALSKDTTNAKAVDMEKRIKKVQIKFNSWT